RGARPEWSGPRSERRNSRLPRAPGRGPAPVLRDGPSTVCQDVLDRCEVPRPPDRRLLASSAQALEPPILFRRGPPLVALQLHEQDHLAATEDQVGEAGGAFALHRRAPAPSGAASTRVVAAPAVQGGQLKDLGGEGCLRLAG